MRSRLPLAAAALILFPFALITPKAWALQTTAEIFSGDTGTGWTLAAPSRGLAKELTKPGETTHTANQDFIEREIPGLLKSPDCFYDLMVFTPNKDSRLNSINGLIQELKTGGGEPLELRSGPSPVQKAGYQAYDFVMGKPGKQSSENHYFAVETDVRFILLQVDMDAFRESPAQSCSAPLSLFREIVESLKPRSSSDKRDASTQNPSPTKTPEKAISGVRKKPRDKTKTDAGLVKFEKSLSYLLEGHLYSAEEQLNQLIEKYPNNTKYHLFYASVLKLMERLSDSQKQVDAVHELDAQFDAHLQDFFCTEKNVPQKAKKDRALMTQPADPCVSISDGLIREAMGNPKGALEAYSHAIAVAPDYWLAHAFRGILRLSLKKCTGAVKDLNEAVRLNPRYRPYARYYLSQCPNGTP